MYWKTSLCCLNDGNGGDDEGALMRLLWVLCPDEEDERREGEVKAIYSCREEALEALPSPLREVTPAVWVSLLLSPSPSPPLCLCSCSSPLREQAEMREVDGEEDDDPVPPF